MQARKLKMVCWHEGHLKRGDSRLCVKSKDGWETLGTESGKQQRGGDEERRG